MLAALYTPSKNARIADLYDKGVNLNAKFYFSNIRNPICMEKGQAIESISPRIHNVWGMNHNSIL